MQQPPLFEDPGRACLMSLQGSICHMSCRLQTEHGWNAVAGLEELGPAAAAALWWPTTQHALVAQADVQVTSLPMRSVALCGFLLFRQLSGPSQSAVTSWPFCVMQVIDGRSGEAFHALACTPDGGAALQQRYDGCASWWTQVAQLPSHGSDHGSMQSSRIFCLSPSTSGWRPQFLYAQLPAK